MRREYVWALVCGLALNGCGGPSNQPVTQEDMKQTALSEGGELLRGYQFEKKKPPATVADLSPMESMSPTGLNAIKSGAVVVRLGAELPDVNEGPPSGSSDEVLAYEKEVPTSGGQVLMLNRTIKTMTAEEFKSAKLAGKSSSDAAGAARKK